MAAITYTALREFTYSKDASFVAFLNDLGNGAVDTSLYKGTGVATFTRATAAASRLASGLWKLDVASGVARSHYLDDLSYGGYLSEGAATELITVLAGVRDVTNAVWNKTNMTTAKTSVGIDGAANACTRLTATAGNATALTGLTAGSAARTYSVFIKRITGSGNIQLTQDNGAAWTTVSLPLTGFNRVTLTATVANPAWGIRIVTNGDAIDVDYNQLEAGSFATTPIPAAGARNADVLTYPTSGNLLGTIGTAYLEESNNVSFTGLSPTVLGTSSTTAIMGADSARNFSLFDPTQRGTGQTIPTSQAIVKLASSWRSGGTSMSINGSIGVESLFDGDLNITAIAVGCKSNGIDHWNGTIKNLHIWTSQLTDAQLQETTGGDNVHILGSQYSLEFGAQIAQLGARVEGVAHYPLDRSKPEKLVYGRDEIVHVTTGPITEADMPKWREWFASVETAEEFTFDRYGTVAAPVEPRTAILISESYDETRENTIYPSRYFLSFDVQLY